MQIQIEFTGQLRTLAGRDIQRLELSDASTLRQLLQQLASELPDEAAAHLLTPAGEVQPSLLVALNHEAVVTTAADQTQLATGDVVTLMPPIAGG